MNAVAVPSKPAGHHSSGSAVAAGLGRALHAEWTKARTIPGVGALVIATVVLTIGLGAVVSAAAHCGGPGCGQDPARVSLTGMLLGQALAAILAVQLVGGEYGTGMIRTTLAATPRRLQVLAAKATVLCAMVLPVGLIAAFGSWVAGRILLPGNGFTVANVTALQSLSDGPTLRALLGSALYLVLISLLALGIAFAIRDPAAIIGVVLGVIYLFGILAGLVTDPDWQRRLMQIAPMNAGLAIQSTVDLDALVIGPWAGLGVLAGWAAGGLLLGGLVLHRRDA